MSWDTFDESPSALQLMINLQEGMWGHIFAKRGEIWISKWIWVFGDIKSNTLFHLKQSRRLKRTPIPDLKRRTIYWEKKKVGRGLEKIRCTWVPARPHTSRWIHRSFRSAGCSGRARGGGWEHPGPSGCCRPSAAPCRWCNRWRGCRSYQLFLEMQARSPVSHSRWQNPTGSNIHGCCLDSCIWSSRE